MRRTNYRLSDHLVNTATRRLTPSSSSFICDTAGVSTFAFEAALSLMAFATLLPFDAASALANAALSLRAEVKTRNRGDQCCKHCK